MAKKCACHKRRKKAKIGSTMKFRGKQKKVVNTVAGVSVGFIGGQMVGSAIPAGEGQSAGLIKAGVKILGGIFLAKGSKGNFGQGLGIGVAASGGVDAINSLVDLPALLPGAGVNGFNPDGWPHQVAGTRATSRAMDIEFA